MSWSLERVDTRTSEFGNGVTKLAKTHDRVLSKG